MLIAILCPSTGAEVIMQLFNNKTRNFYKLTHVKDAESIICKSENTTVWFRIRADRLQH